MQILLTGASSFLGRSVALAFAARGDRVTAIDVPDDATEVRRRFAAAKVHIESVSLQDEPALARVFKSATVVVHTALHPREDRSLEAHERNNLIATENVLAACQHASVPRLVHVTTEAITAGNHHRDYVDESFPQPDHFLDAQARTCALAEDLVLGASGSKGLSAVSLRRGWLWGADDNELLPSLLRASRAKKLTLVDDGRRFVPSCYIDNAVRAVVLAASAENVGGNAYYITDDERVSCRQFFGRMFAAVGASAPKRSMPFALAYASAWMSERFSAQPSWTRADVARLGRVSLFNIKRARDELGYAPEVTVSAGLAKLTRWSNAVGGLDRIINGDVVPMPTEVSDA